MARGEGHPDARPCPRGHGLTSRPGPSRTRRSSPCWEQRGAQGEPPARLRGAVGTPCPWHPGLGVPAPSEPHRVPGPQLCGEGSGEIWVTAGLWGRGGSFYVIWVAKEGRKKHNKDPIRSCLLLLVGLHLLGRCSHPALAPRHRPRPLTRSPAPHRVPSPSPVIVPVAEGAHGDGEGLPHRVERVLHHLRLVADGEAAGTGQGQGAPCIDPGAPAAPCSRAVLVAAVEDEERVGFPKKVLLVQLVGTQLHGDDVLGTRTVTSGRLLAPCPKSASAHPAVAQLLGQQQDGPAPLPRDPPATRGQRGDAEDRMGQDAGCSA